MKRGWQLVVLGLALAAADLARGQSFSNLERGRVQDMLIAVKDDIQKYYYDPAYHGVNIDAEFRAAQERIKHATSYGQGFAAIAQVLNLLNDSHTFFIPPGRSARTQYGWEMQMIGDRCYVTGVRPGSDTAAKGLKPGDLVVSVDGIVPTRDNLWKLRYVFYTLRPQTALRLVVQRAGESERQVDTLAKVEERKRIYDLTFSSAGGDIWDLIRQGENLRRLERQRWVEFGDVLLIWRMPAFNLNQEEVDTMMDKVRKYKALVLDLRGNPGGAVKTLQRVIGSLFGHDVKIGENKRRKESKELIAKTRGSHAFDGKLAVLVDSQSASAAEILARVVQLEKRGTVIGDRTEGAVMESRWYGHQQGTDTSVFYGAFITDADLIMTDGRSLEHTGVSPDEIILPTAADLANDRDPVMSRAAELLGARLGPEKAGKLFPLEWPNP